MFVTSAYAQDAAAPAMGAGDLLIQFVRNLAGEMGKAI